MKYPCEVIKDLLPLYTDNVCSQRTREIVTTHLQECEDCRRYSEELQSDTGFARQPAEKNEDLQMVQSLKKVKKAILTKRIIAVIASVAVVICMMYRLMLYLTQSLTVIPYQGNITVSESVPQQFQSVQGQDYLSAEFVGNKTLWATQKRVDIEIDGVEERIIYFYGQTNRLEKLTADKNTITYHLLSPINRENDITRVYYYTGDEFDNLEKMNARQLKSINRQAVLLWEKSE